MTALTTNGTATAATTLVTAGKMFAATGGTSGNTSTKVGTSTGWKHIYALGFSGTSLTGAGSLPAPTDSNFHGWMWDVTTLEGQRLAAGTYTPTIHLLASTGTTVTPTVEWYKRSSAGVYTQIGTVAGSSIALTTSSQLLVFTAPSLALMDFATGDKLCCWLWVNQTAGGGSNSTISVVEAISGSTTGTASEAQTVTPGYTPTPVALSVTMAGVGTLTRVPALGVTMSGVGTLVVDPYGAELYGVRLYGTETLTLTTVLSTSLAGAGTLAGTWSLATALTRTLPGAGTLAGSLSANLALSSSMAGTGALAGTLALSTALTDTMPGVGTLTGALTAPIALTNTIAGVGTLSATFTLTTALSTTLAGVGLLSPTLSATTALTSTLAGVGTLTATSGESTALVTTIAGVGTLTGTTTLETSLALTMAGVGTLSGTLAAAGSAALSATMPGVGTLAAQISAHVILSTSLVGAGTFSSGVFALRVALSLTCAGVGLLSPNLSITGTTIQFLTATWVARDLQATWTTRDEQASWETRDERALAWKAR